LETKTSVKKVDAILVTLGSTQAYSTSELACLGEFDWSTTFRIIPPYNLYVVRHITASTDKESVVEEQEDEDKDKDEYEEEGRAGRGQGGAEEEEEEVGRDKEDITNLTESRIPRHSRRMK